MNRLSTAKRIQVVSALVEGVSINATCRMTGVAKHTVLNLLRDLGCAAASFHHRNVRGLKVKRLQCDEIWAFVGAKKKNATLEQKAQGWGDAWTWVGIDADTKLVGSNVDYAQLHKIYGAPTEEDYRRYSPAKCIGCDMKTVMGDPDPAHVSTSYVERSNLSMRMGMRRFTRLTNGFSKKLDNHGHAVALYFLHYNFCRVHQTLRVTPAMEAGLADHVWEISELIAL